MRARTVLLGAGTLLVVAVVTGLLAQPYFFGPNPVTASGVVVRVPAGAGAGETGRRLQAAGVIRSALAFRWLATWTSSARRLKAGEYRFEGAPTPRSVLDRLVAGDVVVHGVTLPEGLTLAQTAAHLEAAGLEVGGSLADEVRRVEWIADLDDQADDLEGYLYPDTYSFARGVPAPVIVQALVARFREVSGRLRKELGEPRGSVRDWVTLASLVEKETARDDERARVAAVFSNRLRAGIPLQCDPTVIYALGEAGLDAGESLADRLAFDHPYNTYLYPGLPPGPIANPGEASLRSALRPAATGELYFVADGRGGHRFSRTLDDHNRAVQDLRRRTRAAGRR